MSQADAAPRTRTATGLKLDAYQVVIRPVITEKGTHQAERHNAYTFHVHPQASKQQVKRAVEELFDVTVVSVRTQSRRGKTRRYRQYIGRTARTKKAVVKLSERDRISLF